MVRMELGILGFELALLGLNKITLILLNYTLSYYLSCLEMNFVDLTYHYLQGMTDPETIVRLHQTNLLYLDHLPPGWRTSVIKFMEQDSRLHDGRSHFYFFTGKKGKTWIPKKTHQFLALAKPDVVLVHGLIFQLQVMALRRQLGKKVKILVQHHGEQPFKGLRKILQRVADRYIDGYLFTSEGNAAEWVRSGQIKSINKVYEVLPGTSDFKPLNKEESRRRCGMTGTPNFLWVGRLNTNKDPETVVKAFLEYTKVNPAARLYMIYQTTEKLREIEALCVNQEAIKLIGQQQHDELQHWYSAADYFITGSHRESCGYALLEAMACGCVPIVTQIPSFMKITGNGKAGFNYAPGNVPQLVSLLSGLRSGNEDPGREVLAHFEKELSLKAVGERIGGIVQQFDVPYPSSKKPVPAYE